MITFLTVLNDDGMFYIPIDQISYAIDSVDGCTVYLKDHRLISINIPGKKWDAILRAMKATTINTENLTE